MQPPRPDGDQAAVQAHPSGFKQFVTIGQRMVSQVSRIWCALTWVADIQHALALGTWHALPPWLHSCSSHQQLLSLHPQHAPACSWTKSPVTDVEARPGLTGTSTQGLRCFSLFLVRIIVGALLSIIYAASYSDQGYTFTAATERGFIFMLVTGILPLLTLTSLPVYHNSWKVGAACCPSPRLPCSADLVPAGAALAHVSAACIVQAWIPCCHSRGRVTAVPSVVPAPFQ